MRSLLTSLGIIIGVGSVIIMLAVGEGAQSAIEDQIKAMGTNLLQVGGRRVFMRQGQAGAAMPRPGRITRKDAEKVKEESSYAIAVSGVTQRAFTITGGGQIWSSNVMGVEPGFFYIRSWKIEEGVFFEDEDLYERNRVAVIGKTTATQLFGEDSPVGQPIRIGSNNFIVIGVLERKGAGMGGNDQDDVILVPLDTALTRLMNTQNLSSIMISVVDKKYMDAAQKETELIMREAHRLRETDTPDFEIMNSAELIDMASEMTRTITALLAAIAGVSLLVGGIGIMNIMLVSVTERTREIGIRMAVGARKRDIMFQFLAESVFLSLMGGVLGIGLAFLCCELMYMVGVPALVNPLVVVAASLFACFIGIFFGFYPARKAAGLYPIDALRYE